MQSHVLRCTVGAGVLLVLSLVGSAFGTMKALAVPKESTSDALAEASTPAVNLTPSTLTFASQAAGSNSAARSVTLTNSGNALLTLTDISLTGGQADDYVLTKTCGSSLAAGASCVLSVVFKPVSAGAKSAKISIDDDAADSPESVALTGAGTTAGTPSPSPTTIPSATQIVDSHLNVWTVSGGQAYENGQLTASAGVILLLYAAGIVYQENLHHDWWLWSNGVWVATAAPLITPSSETPTQLELNQADVDVNWLTSNKGYLGYRYSALAHLTDQNVHSLTRICSFDVAKKGSFPSALVAYQQLLYTTTSYDIFAINASSCQKRWSYTHIPDANTASHNNKGAAIANGRVFRGTPDGHLIALDAANGALLWDQKLVSAALGEYLTGVPLVWKNLVFIGKAGGEMGIRGEVMAVRATDGTVIWRFNTIPGPGEPGSDTWENSGSFEHGGGGTWTSFSLDATAGLLLVPVGNPGPDFANQVRPGTNLFTNSFVALDALTGQLKWWHQLVGPDFHDWDTSVLAAFDTADGSHLVAGAGKDGYLRVVDRATGQLRFKAPIVSRIENGTVAIPTTSYVRFCPVGATQWNGPAFSPASGFLYMNGIDRCGSAIKGPTPTYQAGKPYLGLATPNGYPTADPIQQAFGLVNAFDPKDGRMMWTYRAPTPLVAGLIATAGNIVITGDISGNLLILNAKTGELVYRESLNAGALDGGLITYEVNGKQYVAAAAGDNSSTYGVSGENTIVILGLQP